MLNKVKKELEQFFQNGYYFVLVGNDSFTNNLSVFLKTGKWSEYTKIYINSNSSFFVEANSDSKCASFDNICSYNSICLLEPKTISKEQWTQSVNKLITPYRNLYVASKNKRLSFFDMMEALEEYDEFLQLQKLLTNKLSLEKIKNCPDLSIVCDIHEI